MIIMSYDMHRDVAVVVPVYNEGPVVKGVIDSICENFSNVFCVDDGSSDDSVSEILKAPAALIRHSVNLGAGAATQTGVDYALQFPGIKYIITIDADDQHDIRDAMTMLAYIKKHKLDIVFGSRFIGKTQDMGAVKGTFLKAAAIFSHRTTGVKLTDPHVGLRVFNRKFAENLKLAMPDFSHASELVRRIGEGGYQYAELPITVTYSDYSKAKGQPMLNAVNIMFDTVLHRISKQ